LLSRRGGRSLPDGTRRVDGVEPLRDVAHRDDANDALPVVDDGQSSNPLSIHHVHDVVDVVIDVHDGQGRLSHQVRDTAVALSIRRHASHDDVAGGHDADEVARPQIVDHGEDAHMPFAHHRGRSGYALVPRHDGRVWAHHITRLHLSPLAQHHHGRLPVKSKALDAVWRLPSGKRPFAEGSSAAICKPNV